MEPLFLLVLIQFIFLEITGGYSRTFTLENRCEIEIWPGVLSGGGHPLLMNGGLKLEPNEAVQIEAPTGWSGRFWARTRCNFDASGKGTCATGDCGGVLQCNGAGGIPPASLAEFTLDSPMDFYDISFVDGFNIPISVYPSSGYGNCSQVQCSSDINSQCPQELQVVETTDGTVVACKSACIAFNQPQYCCTGEFNNPNICKPTNYSNYFKNACPNAYSYAYDDATSTFTCQGANYLISFC